MNHKQENSVITRDNRDVWIPSVDIFEDETGVRYVCAIP